MRGLTIGTAALVVSIVATAMPATAQPSAVQPGDIEWKFLTCHVITAWSYDASAPDNVIINAVDDPKNRQITVTGLKAASGFAVRYVPSEGAENIFVDMPFDRLSELAGVTATARPLGVNIAVRPSGPNTYSFVNMKFLTGDGSCPRAAQP